MARQSKKPTIAQLNERIEQLELAMGETQQFLQMIANSARNDILRHDGMIKALCEATSVEFEDHPPLEEEKVDESVGESD